MDQSRQAAIAAHPPLQVGLSRRREAADMLLWALLIAGAVAVTIQRVWLAWDLPLWLDETWTGMIAGQPSWSAFSREAWLDPNAPLYYAVMHVWTGVAGDSNLALRTPSLLFVTAAAILPLVWRVPGLSIRASGTWAALLLLWVPGIIFSLDARSYGLLLLISTGQAIAFTRLLAAPSTSRAAAWCALAALSIVTHYFAAVLVAVQGVTYFAVHRRQALRTWPAALVFVFPIAVGAWHLPRLLHFARPDVAWYSKLSLNSAWELPAFLVGPVTPVFLPLLVVMLIAAHVNGASGRREREEPIPTPWLWCAVGTGAAALIVLTVLGATRPMLTVRYLTPVVPLALLTLVLVAGRARRARFAYTILIGLYLLFALKPATLSAYLEERGEMGYEQASAFLAAAHPTNLVFAADAAGSAAVEEQSLAQTGVYFLKRSGLDVKTVNVILDPDRDPHRQLLGKVRGRRPAILWFYVAEGSAAARFPPAIHRIGPAWKCLHQKHRTAGVVACAPRRLFV